MSSLKEIVRKRILVDMIRSIQPASKWKIVVVDARSLKILNSACKQHDIVEENVTLVEDISRKRTSYSHKEAIYFISPTNESVSLLIDDFSKAKPMYAAAHLFFTAALPDNLFDKIKKSPTTTQYVKTIRELFVDFIAQEPHVFTVDQPSALFSLYNPSSPSAQNQEIEIIAKKLVSVLCTMGELPHIRYYDPHGDQKSMSFRLASTLKSELDELAKLDPDYPPPSTYKKAILLIVDRPFDLMSMLLHEFTYQAMMNDLLVLDGGKYVYQSDGDTSTQKVNLDESDPIWMLIRYWHFAEAVEYIRETFNRFLSENKAAMSAMGHEEALSGIQNLNQLKDTLSSLPQFQEMKSKFSVHINICQECKSLFERRKLDSVASVEQDLSTGETADGRTPRNIIIDMGPLLDDPAVLPYDKLRLLMMYIIAQEGILDADRRRLLETSKLSLEDSQAITNLGYLGVKLSGGEKKKKTSLSRYAYFGRVAEKKKQRKKRSDDDVPYDLSRYVPMLKYLIEDQVNNTVEGSMFPWVIDPPADEIAPTPKAAAALANGRGNSSLQPLPSAGNPYSLRTTRPSWALKPKSLPTTEQGGPNAASNNHSNEDEYRKNGPRIIIFTLGGLSFSEIRAAHEIMSEYKRDIIIGSTSINNPTQFINVLKQIHKSEGHVHLGSQSLANSLGNLAGVNSNSPKASQNNLSKEISGSASGDSAKDSKEDKKVGLKALFKGKK